jgi:hypothetical protein
VAQLEEVGRRHDAGPEIVEVDVADGLLDGARAEAGNGLGFTVLEVGEEPGGNFEIPVDDTDVQAVVDCLAEQVRAPGRRHRDELADLLGQKDLECLGLEAGLAFGDEEERLEAEITGAALDAEDDLADIAVPDALHHDAEQGARLRAKPASGRRGAVLQAARRAQHSRPAGGADGRVPGEHAADRCGRHPGCGCYVLDRHRPGHGEDVLRGRQASIHEPSGMALPPLLSARHRVQIRPARPSWLTQFALVTFEVKRLH